MKFVSPEPANDFGGHGVPLDSVPRPSNLLNTPLRFSDEILTHLYPTPTENAGIFAVGTVIRWFLNARSGYSTKVLRVPACQEHDRSNILYDTTFTEYH